MLLTKEQLEKRLASDRNITNNISKLNVTINIKDGINHEGRVGAKNLSEEDKVNIGVLANLEGNELAAEVFGVSPNTARHLRTAQETNSHGQGTQQHTINTSLREKIQERIEETKLTVSERAAERLLKTFGVITDDKLENLSAKDASQVAVQMSNVIRNMNGQTNDKNKGGPRVNITINKPKEIDEKSFDFIEVQTS